MQPFRLAVVVPLLLLSLGCAHKASIAGATFTAVSVNAGNGEVGLQMNNPGAKLCLSATDCIYDSAGSVAFSSPVAVSGGTFSGNPVQLTGTAASGSGSVGVSIDTSTAWSAGKPLTVSTGGSVVASVDYQGKVTTAGGVTATGGSFSSTTSPANFYGTSSSASAFFFGSQNDGASAIGAVIGAGNPITNASAKVVSFGTNLASGTETEKSYIDINGVYAGGGVTASNTSYAGIKTLSTGTATQTVFSGARCICTDSTANASIKCSVSTTTLTFTGTGSDVIVYFCF